MKYIEQATVFRCESELLIGILAKPEVPAQIGIIVIVGGPQYRVGSHRQFVLLSRMLAKEGYAVLRFDYRGMGDSGGPMHSFDSVSADVASAIGELQLRIPSIQNVVLWGLCDGASASLLYLQQTNDPRVKGLCLLNPWIRSETSLARTQVRHYYFDRFVQREFWQKLLTGRIAFSSLRSFARQVSLALSSSPLTDESPQTFQQKMAIACNRFQGSVLLLLSSEDYTAKEFTDHVKDDALWLNALSLPRRTRHVLKGADHTFSNVESRANVAKLTLNWLDLEINQLEKQDVPGI
jgi:uncharacterized protein